MLSDENLFIFWLKGLAGYAKTSSNAQPRSLTGVSPCPTYQLCFYRRATQYVDDSKCHTCRAWTDYSDSRNNQGHTAGGLLWIVCDAVVVYSM
ncbi:uncharacterized protein ARMOST_00191 [Armillaria ostoyae]|uniref:Uncharacterized protein n=1 Tax=Armillaria ostoyae TaxID=47428 RepID=A0A284QKG5_ARMOS|nr:uncharacterized protein ARMOST_00191 [Armillaria ostoyae]